MQELARGLEKDPFLSSSLRESKSVLLGDTQALIPLQVSREVLDNIPRTTLENIVL